MSSKTHTTCPQCKGEMSMFGFPSHGAPRYFECDMCRGTGFISNEHKQRFDDGRKLRAERIERGESLGDAAARQGLSVVELSRIENGGIK